MTFCEGLLSLLDEKSNIMQFQKEYQIFNQSNTSTAFIERVWPEYDDVKKEYIFFEETTHLQKAAKKRLLENEILSSGQGINLRYFHS